MNNQEKLLISVLTVIFLAVSFLIYNAAATISEKNYSNKKQEYILSKIIFKNIKKQLEKTLTTFKYQNRQKDFKLENENLIDEKDIENEIEPTVNEKNVFEDDNDEKENTVLPQQCLYTADGELHVISVYESDYEDENTSEQYDHNPKEIKVNITVKTPITLILDSYEPVIWNLSVENGTKINHIYLSSYYDSKIKVLDKSIPITKTQEHIGLTEANFYRVEELTGKAPKTYQYEYSQNYFLIDGQKGSEYNIFPSHINTNEKVRLQCREDECRLYSDVEVGYNNFGADSNAISNRYYKKGSGKYYFEAELIDLFLTRENESYNVGILFAKDRSYCTFFHPSDDGRCLAYSAIGFNEKLFANGDGKITIGIAIDFDKGKMYYKKNEKTDWEVTRFRNDGREYTAAFGISGKLRWKVNFGEQEFKYKPPKEFKPYNSPINNKK